MIEQKRCEKHYRSAEQRFLQKRMERFFAQAIPSMFGPFLRQKMAAELMLLVEQNYVDVKRLQPGQVLWNALDKHTRGDSPKRRFVPVILTLVSPEDVEFLADGGSPRIFTENAIARIIREAFEQGGILSMRDVSLLTLRSDSAITTIRQRYEEKHQTVLPHTGVLHDMGSCITHKGIILRKIILEKKDPMVVARECNHTQAAVDNYLSAYNRVKTVYDTNQDVDYIHLVTGIARHVVLQYIEILKLELEFE